MTNKFTDWLNNVSIKRKFISLQFFVFITIVLISLLSFISVALVNNSSKKIINEHVRNKEELTALIRHMYVCRVLGRDILFQKDQEVRDELYVQYLNAFDKLDKKMDNYAALLHGEQLVTFKRIIEEKNIYKDSMILSADIWISGGNYDDALYALQVVTPIANKFFGSIDDFLLEEENELKTALITNDNLVFAIFITSLTATAFALGAVAMFIAFFAKNTSVSLMKLEKAMLKIAKTGNMKTEIPSELYTKDEVGRIAKVANQMKTMLLEYSFYDTLTGGFNTKAYHEELNDIFDEEQSSKDLWCIVSDLNNLKIINDSLGHLEGDNAIRISYYFLNEQFKKYGKTFRIGGDEFVSLLSGCTREELELAVSNISQKILMHNTNNEYPFSMAIGYEYFEGSSLLEFKEFFKTVDKKMYENKMMSKQSRLKARVVNPIIDDQADTAEKQVKS